MLNAAPKGAAFAFGAGPFGLPYGITGMTKTHTEIVASLATYVEAATGGDP
jgi:hypothetical protein